MTRATSSGFIFAMLAATAMSAQSPIPLRDLELRGTLLGEKREVDAVIRVSVSTPLGRIPVSGHGRLRYSCGGTFSGTMSYNPIVRFFARLKGVALVTALDGYLKSSRPIDCEAAPSYTMYGRARVDSTEIAGWMKVESDSIVFRAHAWTFGDSTYHSTISTMRGDTPIEMRINMYKKSRGKSKSVAYFR